MELRKVVTIRETVYLEAGRLARRAIQRAAAIAVIANPYENAYVDDLSELMDIGERLGEMLMPELVRLLGATPLCYGKGAIVGARGDLEHGAALIHPRLGRPMRAAVGGGEAIICSNVKVGAPGASLDVPLANKDNIWSFDELDTMTVSVADSPRPSEIAVVMAIADGGRPNPRVGKGRV